jgi:hypothetical protein
MRDYVWMLGRFKWNDNLKLRYTAENKKICSWLNSYRWRPGKVKDSKREEESRIAPRDMFWIIINRYGIFSMGAMIHYY